MKTSSWLKITLKTLEITSDRDRSFTSFHALKFQVVYLALSTTASIHVSRAILISINAFKKFIVWGSLQFAPFVYNYL